MKIYKFLNYTWQEIPDIANPAMNQIQTENGMGNEPCIIICKGTNPRITDGGFIVLENPLHGDIISRGVFWDSWYAELFASFFYVDKGVSSINTFAKNFREISKQNNIKPSNNSFKDLQGVVPLSHDYKEIKSKGDKNGEQD